MKKSPVKQNICNQFIFDDYILRGDGILIYKNEESHVPPKEFEVLTMLLSADGKIVSKEDIFNNVWNTNAASDESLTRCIYALRRILREDKNKRYIETVYSKGYRFRTPVVIVAGAEPSNIATSIAIFPFRCQSTINESFLHHKLIQGLSKYSHLGLNIFPASVTQECCTFISINNFINQLKPDYYFTGSVIQQEDEYKLFVEFIRAHDHHLMEHQTIGFKNEIKITTLLPNLVNLIMNKVPDFHIHDNNIQRTHSIDVAIKCLTGRSELCKFTPESIEHALSLFLECINTHPQYAQPYCYLAECYLSLTQLGLFHHKHAIKKSMEAVDKAIELEPCNSQALGLLGLLTGLKNENSVSEVMFKHAHLLAPVSADIYYYQSFLYFLNGNFSTSLKYIDQCLDIDSTKTSAIILKLWLTYYSSTAEQALLLGQRIITSSNDNNPILKGMIALFSALKGNSESTINYLNNFPQNYNKGDLAANSMYLKYLLYGQKVKEEIIYFVNHNEMKGSLLPLIKIAYGHLEMQRCWEQLKKENNPWLNIWPHDPRLSDLKSSNSRISTNVQ